MALDIKAHFLDQLKAVEQLHLPQCEYLIWGSGPLAVRNLRASNDVDLVVTKSIWNQLVKIYQKTSEKMLRIGNIEIWNDCLNLTDQINEMVAHPDMIEGFPFMTLRATIQWKRFMNRDKDLKDIALIEKYLKELVVSGSIGSIST